MRAACLGLTLLCAATVLGACTSEAEGPSYKQQVLQHRLQKDMDLRDRQRTVLTREALSRFEGLRYFPVDTTYRFEAPLQRLGDPDTVYMAQRIGEPVPQVKVGTVAVPLPQGTETLSVFRTEGSTPGDPLWIPFRDATSGRESYGAGRYLDVPVREDGTVLVDFNRAYNPLCDYNPQEYNCSLPPPENELPMAVEAGEKKSLLSTS